MKIKIHFTDFWPGFDNNNNFILNIIKRISPNVTLNSNNPDFVFCSAFGDQHFKYDNCIKIYYTGENDVPNFNFYDYAISFHEINFGERHLRFPLFVMYECFKTIRNRQNINENLTKRKFCNFVYSNNNTADPIRDHFFKELSKYKKVDSGGRHLNNIGGNGVPNKLDFIKDYKFTIAFENSSVCGYTTEKIMEPMTVNSIPIYWGNPNIGKDFNTESFIEVKNYEDIQHIINKIIYLDNNDEAYLKVVSNPCLNENNKSYEEWCNTLESFLKQIFYTHKRQRAEYGLTNRINEKYRNLTKYDKIEKIIQRINKLKI